MTNAFGASHAAHAPRGSAGSCGLGASAASGGSAGRPAGGRLFGGRRRPPPKRVALDGNLIRENRLSVLTLDERWNSLFRCAEKTPAIARGEEILNGCIKEQARLTAELGECRTRKKLLLGRIVELTRHAFNRGGESAKREISECEAQIRAIKAREPEIDERLSMLRNDIKNANMELLETAAGHVYQDIFDSRRQLDLLDGEIAGLSERLGARTAEREVLAKSSAEAYAGLLDLLGAEQMDELEKYFSG